jgi:hypothetical protein
VRAISPRTDGALGTNHLASTHRHTFCIRLQQLRTDLDRTLGDLLACGRHRATRHHHAARAPGAGRIGRHRGIAVHDLDPGHIDAEDFVGNLRKRGLQALAVRMHADAQFESAVRRDPRRGLLVSRHHGNAPAVVNRRSMRRLLAIDR